MGHWRCSVRPDGYSAVYVLFSFLTRAGAAQVGMEEGPVGQLYGVGHRPDPCQEV